MAITSKPYLSLYWPLLRDMFHRCELWQNHVSEGCYPDCDMLPLGWLGKGFACERQTNFTKDEQRTMMTLWCLFGSPLMLGAEMTRLDDWTLSLLTNRHVLAMLTPDCRPRQICLDDKKAIWIACNEKEKTKYAALFNLSDEESVVSVSLEELGMTGENSLLELWTGEQLAGSSECISPEIPAHGCVVYQFN